MLAWVMFVNKLPSTYIKVFLRTPLRELLQTPLILLHFLFAVKKRRNWHRHDYSEIDDGSKVRMTMKWMLEWTNITPK